jgi:hypothetical protein
VKDAGGFRRLATQMSAIAMPFIEIISHNRDNPCGTIPIWVLWIKLRLHGLGNVEVV